MTGFYEGNSGTVSVAPHKLEDHTNVEIDVSTLIDGDVPTWDSTLNKYVNRTGETSKSHAGLTDRGLADQHPASAISGFETAVIEVNTNYKYISDAPVDTRTYGRSGGIWKEIADAGGTDFDVQDTAPTVDGTQAGQLVLATDTGVLWEWVEGSGTGSFEFNNPDTSAGDQYAVMDAVFNTLGNPAIYGEVSYNYTGANTGIISEPSTWDDNPTGVQEFGRVGSVYHVGSISNLQLKDNSPMQGVYANVATGTIPTINMTNGIVELDYKHIDAPASTVQILNGSVSFLRTVNNVLTLGTTSSGLEVDGVAVTAPELVADRHYHFKFSTASGSLTTVVNQVNNLSIKVTN